MEPNTKRSIDEKHDSKNVAEAPQHHETLHEKDNVASTPTGSDLEKDGPVLGDDSDGRIVWTPTSLIATISLSALYVGMSPHHQERR